MNNFWLLLSVLFFSACGGGGSGGSQAPMDQGQAPAPETSEDAQVQGEAGLEGYTLHDRIPLIETK